MREDWVEIELGELCKFSQGVQVPKGKQYTEDNENRVRFLRIIDFTQGKDEPRYIDKPNDINIVAKDDISMVRYGTVGFVCTGIEGAIANNLFRIIPNIDINKKFLINFLNSVTFKSQINAKGATMQALSFGLIKPIKVTLPPLVEQKAIVKKIEELFSSLDSGIADLKKAQDQLVIYRQAVLKKAFEGELTKEWREKNDIKREKWNTNKLGEVLKTIDGDRGKNYPKKHELLNEGYCLFLSTKNVRQGEFVFKENLFLTKEKDDLLRGGKLERNDVVLTTRGTLGNVALYDSKVNFNNIRINSGMLILRVNNQSELSQPFLMQFINSSLFFQQLKAKQSGTAQPQIPARVLREIEIEIPNEIKEQYQIVQEIESRLSVCDKVEKDIVESLEKAQALRQSILKKAFEGTLLSEEEIAKCKADKDYEPASVLLEKIKAQKKKK